MCSPAFLSPIASKDGRKVLSRGLGGIGLASHLLKKKKKPEAPEPPSSSMF